MERLEAFDGWITMTLFLQTMRDAGKEIHLEDGSTCQRRGSGELRIVGKDYPISKDLNSAIKWYPIPVSHSNS